MSTTTAQESTEADDLVVEICNYFFDDDIERSDVNDKLRRLAPEVLHGALEMTKLLDMVPRPTGRPPGLGWIKTQAIRALWRRTKNDRVYLIARRAIQYKYAWKYDLAKLGQ